MVVPPGAFLLVWADGTNDTLKGCHTSFKLNVAGESLGLFASDGSMVDSLVFPRMYEDISFGRSLEGELVHFREPTPGFWNTSSSVFRVAGRVRFDPPAGIYASGQEVSLVTGEEGGVIRYTLDGSEPNQDAIPYTGPIPVTSTMVIRARQWMTDQQPSDPSTSSYMISDGFTLPVISLATNPDNLFDDQIGIYVTGTNGVPGYCNSEPQNWNMDWEKPMSFEYFDREGTHQLQIDGGVKIHGGCSRNAPLKSLGFFARTKYGSNSLDYRFFREKEADSFKGLILRNSGNDFWYSFIRDAVVQATATTAMDVDGQAYEPVQVFINGEYWGIHNLREKVNEHWVTSNYGIPDENLDFIKNSSEVFAGSLEAFDALYQHMEHHSLVEEANYQVVADQIDIDAYINYLVTQMYFANRDWPGNNQKYWRDRVNGTKWRWILFDTDFSLGLYTGNAAIDMFSFVTADTVQKWPNPYWATLQIRRLLENEGFRDKFLQRYMMHLNTTFSTERVIGVIDSLYLGIRDLFPVHLNRWNQYGSMEKWEEKVDELRQFAQQRPAFVWYNMQQYFSLGSVVQVAIPAADQTGAVMLNGMGVPPEGFVGRFASGTDLDVAFIPEPGYRFSHWEVTTQGVVDDLLIPRNSRWRYLDTGNYPGDGWNGQAYDDSGWPSGKGELGYGDGNEATVLDFGPDDQDKHITYYFRTGIELPDTSRYDRYVIRLKRDDGALVYVNGTEVIRDNMPSGEILPGTVALTFVGGEEENAWFEFPVERQAFRQGSNTIAVEIHQNGPGSSDISFDLELAAAGTTSVHTITQDQNPLSMKLDQGVSIRPVAGREHRDVELFINEFMATSSTIFMDSSINEPDWIEIYNGGDADVDMAGICFTDSLQESGKWRIPEGDPEATTIPAGGHLLFYADGDPLLGPLHLDFKLDAQGEAIGLSYRSGPETVWLDTMWFGEQVTNISWGRYPDGSSDWYTMPQSTPGEVNVRKIVSVIQDVVMEIALYPNPVSDLLHVRIILSGGTPPEVCTLSLCDLNGRRLLVRQLPGQGHLLDTELDVSSLPDGVYLLVVENTQGTHTCRFIKSVR